MYYIISLCHTNRNDPHITLWRSNNAGYCYSKEFAGIYETPKEGYHNSDSNMPVEVDDLNKLFIEMELDREQKEVIPNCALVWKALGVKMTKNGLIKIKKSC